MIVAARVARLSLIVPCRSAKWSSSTDFSLVDQLNKWRRRRELKQQRQQELDALEQSRNEDSEERKTELMTKNENEDEPLDLGKDWSMFAPFFDDRDLWGVDRLMRQRAPGRAWTIDELRYRSNAQLHQLWYLLLKERNMLLTMKFAYEARFMQLPTPERLYRVEESMENLETVVDERNRAYNLLEHGNTGETPTRRVTQLTGWTTDEPLDEHLLPPRPEDIRYETPELNDDQEMFQKLWAEDEWWRKQYKRDDLLARDKKHRHVFRNEESMRDWHAYHPDNK